MSEAADPVETTFRSCFEDVKVRIRTCKARVVTLSSELEKLDEQVKQMNKDRSEELVKLAVLLSMGKSIESSQQTIVSDAITKLTTPDHKG